MYRKNKGNKESGFSLLELSVAVGVAAIVATAGIAATTAFIGSAQNKRDSYTDRANNSILEAESASVALGASSIVEPDIALVYSHSITLPSSGEVWGSATFNSVSGSYILIENPSAELVALVQNGGLTTVDGTFQFAGEVSNITVEAAGYCTDSTDGCDPTITSNPSVYVKIPGFVVDGNNLYNASVSSLVFAQP